MFVGGGCLGTSRVEKVGSALSKGGVHLFFGLLFGFGACGDELLGLGGVLCCAFFGKGYAPKDGCLSLGGIGNHGVHGGIGS